MRKRYERADDGKEREEKKKDREKGERFMG